MSPCFAHLENNTGVSATVNAKEKKQRSELQ